MNKLLSGRWIFTVVSAVVFAYSSFTGTISGENTMGLIMLVVTFYFSKERT